jgi:hypothetical protein
VDTSERGPRWILKEGSEYKEKEDVQQEDRNKDGRPNPQGRKDGRKEGHGRGGEAVLGRERDREAWLLDDPHTVLMLKEDEQEAVFFGMGYFVGCFIVGCK